MTLPGGGYLQPTNNLTAQPHSRSADPKVGPRCVPMTAGFVMSSNGDCPIDLSGLVHTGALDEIQSVHWYYPQIDDLTVDLDLVAQDTGHQVRLAQGSMGCWPILCKSAKFRIQPLLGNTPSTSPLPLQLWFSNTFEQPSVYHWGN